MTRIVCSVNWIAHHSNVTNLLTLLETFLMQVVRTVKEMTKLRSEISGPVGLVATLGGIHVGHTTHIDVIRPQCETLVGSLFLNPTQFGQGEDLSEYPAEEKADLNEFDNHGADIVFVPNVDEIYPKDGSVRLIDPGPIARELEGIYRPGHFDGVATVVARLFSIIRPHKATFGEKDAQQLGVIKHVVKSCGFEIDLIPIPTVREQDGLAVSSRNKYLSSEERTAATIVYRSLLAASELFNQGERSGDVLKQAMESVLVDEPLANIEYVSISHIHSFVELRRVNNVARALVSVKIGTARLIDNMILA